MAAPHGVPGIARSWRFRVDRRHPPDRRIWKRTITCIVPAVKLGSLISGTRTWAQVELDSVTASGLINPQLVLSFTLRTPLERIVTELAQLRLTVMCGNEVLGQGLFLGDTVRYFDTACQAVVPVSRRSLEFVTARLGRESHLGLELLWDGQIAVTWSPTEGDNRQSHEPEPGERTLIHLKPAGNRHSASVARSDWYAQVLKPTGGTDYLALEIAVPLGDAAQDWRTVMRHVDSAERSYATGDDSAVFNYLRGAFDALPGAKQHVFDSLPEPKRAAVNELVTSLTKYLHRGRHVSADASEPGDFPVDHQDAAFAINLMRVLLSYTSLVLSRSDPGRECCTSVKPSR